MKAYWPFLLAATITATLVALYLLGRYNAAWVLTFVLISFPVVYAVLAIVWAEADKRRSAEHDAPGRQEKPPPV